jgi:thiamine biosynthesis lipoprotein
LKELIKITNSWLCRLFVICTIGIFFVALAACTDDNTVLLSGPIMGTQYNVTLTCKSDKTDKQWLDQVLPVMTSINQKMSTYISDSEISLFNQSRSTEFQPISSSMVDVFSSAQRVSQETNGAFDITVMPLVNLWGFGPLSNHSIDDVKIPSDEELKKIRQIIGFKKLELDKSFTKWKKIDPNISIDFSAIAKGYAVDQVSNKLLELGCGDHLVEIGGELKASGKNANGKTWVLAVEKPDVLGGIQAIINVSGTSVASSGDYRNFYTIDGKRYSHTIDPRTLRPTVHNLASVTVLDPIASRADALATAFMVMGDDALEFAEVNKIPAYFIFRSAILSTKNKQQYQVLYSQAFEKYISTQ